MNGVFSFFTERMSDTEGQDDISCVPLCCMRASTCSAYTRIFRCVTQDFGRIPGQIVGVRHFQHSKLRKKVSESVARLQRALATRFQVFRVSVCGLWLLGLGL